MMIATGADGFEGYPAIRPVVKKSSARRTPGKQLQWKLTKLTALKDHAVERKYQLISLKMNR